MRPGIQPATSWFLVGFVSAVPGWELLNFTLTLLLLSVLQGRNYCHAFLQRRKLRHGAVVELAQFHSQMGRAQVGMPGSLVPESTLVTLPLPTALGHRALH